MAHIQLAGQTRTELKKQVAVLRAEGFIPAVVYGGKENRTIKIPASAFQKVFAQAGESSIIDLTIDEKTSIPVLVYDVQKHPTTTEVIHIDFFEVDMNKTITANIPLVFTGIAPALKLGGTLLESLDEVAVTCLPKDLPHDITVDLSVLKTFEDSIHVSDLQIPAGVTVTTPGQVLVAKVVEKLEEVETTISEADAVAAVAGEKEKKEQSSEGDSK